MKHLVGKAIAVFTLTLSLSNTKVNAVTRMSLSCPTQFVGTVTKVSTSKSPFPSKSLQRMKVEFDTKDSDENTTIQVLRYGPHRFDIGDTYKVTLRKGYICSVEKI